MKLFSFTDDTLARAEAKAQSGENISSILETLRELSLEDFGLLMISIPNRDYPNLSKVLPQMASIAIQQQWTGYSGLELFAQTAAFARQLECAFVRLTTRPLQGSTILDLGVGYGRNLRSMLYFSNPEELWGVDPWQGSLDLSVNDGVLGNLRLSSPMPESLPVDGCKFDLAYAFSVFTHTSMAATVCALQAVRKAIKSDGVFVCTVRPIEYWSVPGQLFSQSQGEQYARDHLTNGYGFYAHTWSDGSYGDASIAPEFFNREGWKLVGYDNTLSDRYQVALILTPV